MIHSIQDPPSLPEPFLTLKDAARRLGIPPITLQRAARAGTIPTYNIHTGRKLVRLSEIEAIVLASRTGAAR
jgi:excisionase family DNA binding protein